MPVVNYPLSRRDKVQEQEKDNDIYSDSLHVLYTHSIHSLIINLLTCDYMHSPSHLITCRQRLSWPSPPSLAASRSSCTGSCSTTS
jgi:hypothetical protein